MSGESESSPRPSEGTQFCEIQNGQQPLEENPLQGLFNDILGCLGGTPSTTDQVGIKQPKPMTGFLELLNLITETMEAKQVNFTGPSHTSQQDSSQIGSRIHEVFQSTPKISRNVPKIHPQNGFSASAHSAIPTAELATPLQRNDFHQIATPKGEDGAYGFSHGEGDDGDSKFASFPNEIEEDLKKNEEEGLPRNVREAENILNRDSLILSGKSQHKGEAQFDSCFLQATSQAVGLGGEIVIGVVETSCDESSCSGEICSGGSTEVVTGSDLSCESNCSDYSLYVKKTNSQYYDCTTGEESENEEHLWSSAAESEDESEGATSSSV